MNIFVYGSLMFDSVLDTLIETRYKKLDGRIQGYRRLCVKGEVYPGLIESARGRVNGVVLLGISVADIKVLDCFEGNYYRRHPVTVAVRDGPSVHAQTYLFRDEYRDLLSDREWSAEGFGKEGISTFMSQYRGFLQNR